MTERVQYTEFHPRWHRTRFPVFWWLRRRSYLVFVVRELTSVFVAWTVVYLLLLINAVAEDDAAYQRFLDWSGTWWVVLLNVVALALLLFHTVTWFNLAPKAIVARMRGRPLPGIWIQGAHYLAWALVSAGVAWLILG
ncbi:fumarate reductase subunit C [Actinomadura rudentiformis]|uniref:Fumarate reductase subunit C n=1 Tax=Actinomadura rudentiformis TaxID=359158 RepID=A0A6H9YUP3_9ACTN|nr:fumarate reductase subunit C [Actinomadura rudentiformis]KAB2352327.1 fumarate reductase subunit C [Actinomadura rudentiformis]